MSGTVVGIDPSLTAAGVSVIRHPSIALSPNTPRCVSLGVGGSEDDTDAETAVRIMDQRDRIIMSIPQSVRLVVIEAMPRRIPNPEFASRFLERAALYYAVVAFLASRHVPVAAVNLSTLKLWATGDGHADKIVVHEAMETLWPHADLRKPNGKPDDNRSDSLALATMGVQYLGWYPPELPHHFAPNVRWPALRIESSTR